MEQFAIRFTIRFTTRFAILSIRFSKRFRLQDSSQRSFKTTFRRTFMIIALSLGRTLSPGRRLSLSGHRSAIIVQYTLYCGLTMVVSCCTAITGRRVLNAPWRNKSSIINSAASLHQMSLCRIGCDSRSRGPQIGQKENVKPGV